MVKMNNLYCSSYSQPKKNVQLHFHVASPSTSLYNSQASLPSFNFSHSLSLHSSPSIEVQLGSYKFGLMGFDGSNEEGYSRVGFGRL